MHNLQPIIAIGAVLVKENKILLIKRANLPNKNQWAIPGGKVLPGELLSTAAERELLEETGVCAEAIAPVHIVEYIEDVEKAAQFHFVIIDFKMQYVSGEPQCGSDASEIAWFTLDKIYAADDMETNTAAFLKKWLPDQTQLQTWN